MATDASFVEYVCDQAARAILKTEPAGTPFPGAKPHYCIDEALDDTPLLQRLLRETAAELPEPKPKKPPVRARGSAAR